MPKFYIFVLTFLVSLGAFAQNNISLKGKVLDGESQTPLEDVTVYVTSAKDSTVIDYTITDKSGAFTLATRKTDKPVIFKISFVGFKVLQKSYDKGLSGNIDFGALHLEEAPNVLGEVQVKSEAPPIRIKNDTLEFNAASFKLRPDANVESLLKQLPGVEIDSDGKITVNGKEVNQILVNGKPFFDKDGKVALQNLPSDIINKVQITDTKTKKEELSGEKASSNTASINLTIDEDKNKGFFGKVIGGYGSDQRYESSLMMNYFKNKRKISILGSLNNINSTGFSMNEIFDSMGGGRNYSIWTNDDGSFGINNMSFGGSGSGITKSDLLGINYGDEPFKDFTTNGSYFYTGAKTENTNRTRLVTLLPDGDFTTESQAKTVDDKYAHNINTEFEYKIDSLTTISVAPKFSHGNSKYSSISSSKTINEDGQLAKDSSTDTHNESDNDNFSTFTYLNRAFKKKGRFLSVWAQTENNTEKAANRNISSNNFYLDNDNDGIPDQVKEDNRNQVEKDRNISDRFNGGIEYSEPLKDSISIKVGVNFEHTQNISDRNTKDFDVASQTYSLANDSLTNYLRSGKRTMTPKVGLSLQKSKFNFSLDLGTSVTLFEANSFYLGQKTALSKEYIYPAVNAWGSFRISKSKSFWMNYNYNVDFASAAQVLPVEDVSNPQNTFIGNPDLSPNKAHYLYLSYRDYDFSSKSGFSIYGGGNVFESQIIASTVYDQSRKAYTTYTNVSGNVSGWFGGNWNKTIKREANSYRFGFGLNGNYSRQQGFTDAQLYDSKSWRFTPKVNFNYDYGELLSIAPKYEFTYNDTQYSNFNINKSTSVTHRFTLQTTNYWPKHFIFGNDFSYTYNSNIADGFKKDFYLWNVSLGYNFLGDKLLAKVIVYDMLNQNQNTTRTISSTFIMDQQNVVLKRYAMFSLTYKLEKFGGKKPEGPRLWME
jgi:hypothetical protein